MRLTCVFLFAAMLLSGCPRPIAESPATASPVKKANPNFASNWQNESQYIVETICADLAEMSYLASHGQIAKADEVTVSSEENQRGGVLNYHVVIKIGARSINCDVPMTTPIWAPATYRPVLAALQVKPPAVPASPEPDATPSIFLRTLVTPTPEVLTQADASLSGLLSKEFSAPRRHEEAALLLGAFTLREASGRFYQIRGELCRITAHLAFARQLGVGAAPSSAGLLGEAILTLLYNRQTDVLAQLDSLPETDELLPWKRALRMRVTTDYRPYPKIENPTLLETREWFRARAIALSPDLAWADLKLTDAQESLPDWTRIPNEYSEAGGSVGLGHQTLRTSLPRELWECQLVYKRETGGELIATNFVEALNASPSRFASPQNSDAPPRIIGWGRWAAFLQRHFCHGLAVSFDFMHNNWGVPDEAAVFRDRIDKQFWGLRLYPFVRRANATEAAYYRTAQDEQMALIRRIPEEIPAEAWNWICYSVPFTTLYIPPPHAYINEWHRHNPPPGTAYDPHPRMNHPSLTSQKDTISRLEDLHRMAPYDMTITHNLLRIRDGEQQTGQALSDAYHEVLDFASGPNRRIARLNENNPAEYEKWMLRAAALDPSDLLHLAKFYEKTGPEAKAADAYIRWIDQETDDVSIANDCAFLIGYYERNGQSKKATALAERAAEVYSYAGLMAKANLLETRGNLDEALVVHEQIRKRYRKTEDLFNFLWRANKTKPNPIFEKPFNELEREYLPGGLRPVVISSAPPLRGVLVHFDNDKTRAAGLRKGDIVVASRGYAVDDWKAFKIIRGFDSATPFTMKIWRDGAYLDLDPLPSSYRFDIDLSDYKSPGNAP